MLEQLVAAFNRAGKDGKVRSVLLTSALPSRFSAGLDLKNIAGKPDKVRALLDKLYIELTDVQYGLGMTLAISCDIIIAGEEATFGYPEIDLGLVPAIHFVHLPRIVGRHRAFDLLFSGRIFTAAEALSLGLVSRVVPAASAKAEARKLANLFGTKSANSMRLARAAFMRANDLDYRRGVGYAAELFCNVAATEDAQEGLRAFSEKRPPKW